VDRYQARKSALNELRTALSGATPKVIVFVDELDRCRPDYAVSYLETIKHVFDVKGMVFVLAMNSEQFANSVRAQFGVVNFPEYLRKFVHRTVKLPKVTQQGSFSLVAHLTDKYGASLFWVGGRVEGE
jgi:predicted KAP-like P-loop ATPase